MKRNLIISVGIAAILLAVVAMSGVFSSKTTPQYGSGGFPPTPVVVFEIVEQSFADVVEAIGTSIANESVDITAKVTDTVSVINFEDGMAVEAGKVLVELTEEEESAAIAEARASLNEAEKQYDRIRDLVANKTASESRLDGAIATRDKAKARVDALEAKLADRIIRAPFAGVLGLRHVSVGTLVRPGNLITTLDDIETVKVDFSVPERHLAILAEGQEILATSVAYPGRSFAGEVKSVDSRVDPVTRSVVVRAQVPNSDRALRPGMLLSINVVTNKRTSLSVPEGALMQVREEVSVWVVDENNAAQRRSIKIGQRRRGTVEVLEGLQEGERVVVEGTIRIRRPGQTLKILNQNEEEPNSPSAQLKQSKT